MAAACSVGYADPAEVDDYLRRATTASLAGDHASARAVLETVLAPICQGDVDLGQHEMVDEVLSADLHDCMCRLVAAAYLTTPLAERVDAVIAAIDLVGGLSYAQDPVELIAGVLGGELPELPAFLPLWIARLEAEAAAGSGAAGGESRYERWLRAAIGRRDGVAGLARLARTSKSTEAARAWCDTLVEQRDWKGALAAYEECAAFAGEGSARGELLDGAALAARELGRKDLTRKLEASWLAVPSLVRLVRWLTVGAPSAASVRRRAQHALAVSPTRAPRILGLLNLLTGDARAAAALLSKAPGLGWSRDDHPGHLLFAAFASLLGVAPAGSARAALTASLHIPPRDQLDDAFADDTEPSVPRLACPSIGDVLELAQVSRRVTADDRAPMLRAMQRAAVRRVDGVLREKRRRHYGHAAALVACCVEIETGGTRAGSSSWLDGVLTRTSRFPAFRHELRRALGRGSVQE